MLLADGAAAADLLHTVNDARVPQACRVVHLLQQAHRRGEVEVQDLQPVPRPLHTRQLLALSVVDAKLTTLDGDLAAALIHLPQGDNVAAETGYVEDITKHTVITIKALEQHRSFASDVNQRAISKFDCAVQSHPWW